MGRHDACGYRAAKAERIADGHNPVTDPGRLAAEIDIGKLAVGLDLQYRQIGPFIRTHQCRGFKFVTIIQHNGELRSVLNDMMVGDDVAVVANEKAGPLRMAIAVRPVRTRVGAGLAGKIVEEFPEIERALENGRGGQSENRFRWQPGEFRFPPER